VLFSDFAYLVSLDVNLLQIQIYYCRCKHLFFPSSVTLYPSAESFVISVTSAGVRPTVCYISGWHPELTQSVVPLTVLEELIRV